jgi:deoxyribodipyrimidine photo-lyase
MAGPAILWFRQDLRLADNPALAAAAGSGQPILALYILDDMSLGRWAMGGASRWWLHGSLAALERSLARYGVPLILRRGPADRVLDAVVRESGAEGLYCNRCYEPAVIARDKTIKAELSKAGLEAMSFNAALLHEPWVLKTGGGNSFKVFTPFHRAVERLGPPPLPVLAPKKLRGFAGPIASEALDGWGLLPDKPDWAGGLRQSWHPGEAGAQKRLRAFVMAPVTYRDGHNRPDMPATSRLSPHLHWGEIGPRQVWHAIEACRAAGEMTEGDASAFLRQIVWREFCHHLLFHFPDLPDQPWRAAFADFPWRSNEALLALWQQGKTGYPIVDAGMRELWVTGWMHNRLRMIAASFLIKDLLQPWQAGEAWFWDTLVDADLAQNAANWQWVAGSGADAAPYFRVFNPVLQGEKFDPKGTYVRRWLPVLKNLPDEFIHCPWLAPADVLESAGVRLGETYAAPMIDHASARAEALASYAKIKKG